MKDKPFKEIMDEVERRASLIAAKNGIFDLSWISFTPEQARQIVAALADVEFRGLMFTFINEAAWLPFLELAKKQPAFQSLNLLRTMTSDEGVKALAAAAKHWPAFQSLSLAKTQTSDEGVKALAAAAEHCPAFQSLDLSDTQTSDAGVKALAAAAKHWPRFKSLDLRFTTTSDKGVKALAAAAEHWPWFKSLDLGFTRTSDEGVKSLVAAASHWPAFQLLFLYGAQTSLPEEILRQYNNPSQIFKFLLERGEQILAEVKLLLVGQAEVGKTHLRKRLFQSLPAGTENRGYWNPAEDRTHDIESCVMQMTAQIPGQDVPALVTYRVWDFGGQDHLHGTHRFFFQTQRCFYILCVNAWQRANGNAAHNNRLSYWLRMLAQYGSRRQFDEIQRAPVLLVRTQCDEVDLARRGLTADADKKLADAGNLDRAIDEARAKNWYGANVVEFIDGMGISDQVARISNAQEKDRIRQRHDAACESLLAAIQKYTPVIPDVPNKYPDNVRNLEGWIESQFAAADGERDASGTGGDNGVKYLSKSAFAKGCGELQIDESTGRFYLPIYRNLGIVHWVGDVPEVESGSNADMKTLVFNPRWVVRPVYELIQSSNQFHTKGWLSVDQIKTRLPAPAVADPKKEHLYQRRPFSEKDRDNIRGLMLASRVAFEDRRRTGMLIPDLLPPLEEHERAVWQGEDVSIFPAQYFSFFPERIFLRYIAEHYDDIQQKNRHCWRNEVIVPYEDPSLSGDSVTALIQPELSPDDGSEPFLKIAIRGGSVEARQGTFREILREFQTLFRLESLDPLKFRFEPIQGGAEPFEINADPVGFTDPDPAIVRLMSETPELNRSNGEWVSNKDAAKQEGVGIEALTEKRKQRSGGIESQCGMIGRDVDGRVWRRDRTQRSHPWYFVPTLVAKRGE